MTKRFTLIELLIVIAVISILASLLFPALNKALATGKRISCQNNLSQWGKVIVLYMDDNSDFFPCPPVRSSWNEPFNTLALLADIYYQSPLHDGAPDYNTSLGVFSCPSSPDKYINHQYCYNNYACSPPANGANGDNHYKMRTVHSPTEFILMADTKDHIRMAYGDYSNSSEPWPLRINYRHLRNTNLLRADGHVESTRESTIGKRYWILGF